MVLKCEIPRLQLPEVDVRCMERRSKEPAGNQVQNTTESSPVGLYFSSAPKFNVRIAVSVSHALAMTAVKLLHFIRHVSIRSYPYPQSQR